MGSRNAYRDCFCSLPDMQHNRYSAGLSGRVKRPGSVLWEKSRIFMNIIDELISKLDFTVPVREICQGAFQTAVQTRNCGLASTPHDTAPHHDKSPVMESGRLLLKDTKGLALLAKSPSPHAAAIGMATINSLIDVEEGNCVELNAGDLLIQKGVGRRVAIIGHFPFACILLFLQFCVLISMM